MHLLAPTPFPPCPRQPGGCRLAVPLSCPLARPQNRSSATLSQTVATMRAEIRKIPAVSQSAAVPIPLAIHSPPAHPSAGCNPVAHPVPWLSLPSVASEHLQSASLPRWLLL